MQQLARKATNRIVWGSRWYASYRPILSVPQAFRAAARNVPGDTVEVQWDSDAPPIDLRACSSDWQTFREVLLEGEYNFALPRSPRVIVDVGANVGLASIWFAAKYPQAQIIAIEAERANYELMTRNLEHYPQITPVHAALWSHAGVLTVDDPLGEGAWAFRTSEGSGGQTVRAMTMHDVLEEFGLDQIDLLKIDIEGAEKTVFSAGDLGWIDYVHAIAVELHDRFEPGCEAAFYGGIGDRFPVRSTLGANTFVSR